WHAVGGAAAPRSSGIPNVAGDLAQADAGSESGFDLFPNIVAYLAAHVRVNLITPASDRKARRFAAGTPPRRPAFHAAGAFRCARGVLMLEKTDDKNVMPKSIDRFSIRLGIF